MERENTTAWVLEFGKSRPRLYVLGWPTSPMSMVIPCRGVEVSNTMLTMKGWVIFLIHLMSAVNLIIVSDLHQWMHCYITTSNELITSANLIYIALCEPNFYAKSYFHELFMSLSESQKITFDYEPHPILAWVRKTIVQEDWKLPFCKILEPNLKRNDN